MCIARVWNLPCIQKSIDYLPIATVNQGLDNPQPLVKSQKKQDATIIFKKKTCDNWESVKGRQGFSMHFSY